jgi:hypothetical protein
MKGLSASTSITNLVVSIFNAWNPNRRVAKSNVKREVKDKRIGQLHRINVTEAVSVIPQWVAVS